MGPELVAHGLLTIILLPTWHPILFLINLPVLACHCYRFWFIPRGHLGQYDPAEIHNHGDLSRHMKESMAKLSFHLIIFFIYLYCMILTLLKKGS
ncbi:PREDICTED: protein cornichon homolog 4-like [Priapulus caudatus]|uniref:Protein cornichon homolog 4-like n=1 Tax=Priapulus caudatus TaxID=37621 RepID=A0ABM1EK23_PRICU|nr:PREDICTED: protein cornichon homolog 4-like [Priapulus caudatus]